MKAYTDEQVKQIEDALEKNLQSLVAGVTFDMTTEALATLRSGQDGEEAVAWIRTTDITELTDSEPETDGWTPLYAAPQSAQPAPLTDEWMADLDTLPEILIETTRQAIRDEFGNNGTDGYYKRILGKVIPAIVAAQPPQSPETVYDIVTAANKHLETP